MEGKIAVVAGATSQLGRDYLARLAGMGYHTVGISRRTPTDPLEGTTYISADLTTDDCLGTLERELELPPPSELILVHAVGSFKFEFPGVPVNDPDGDGFDDQVMESNYGTFDRLYGTIEERILPFETSVLRTVAFGSISDQYHVPFWRSYTEANDRIRNRMQHSKLPTWRSAHFMLSLSTIDIGSERALRPQADRAYWLTCSEVVDATFLAIGTSGLGYHDVPVFRENPDFPGETHYTDRPTLLKRWSFEMGTPT